MEAAPSELGRRGRGNNQNVPEKRGYRQRARLQKGQTMEHVIWVGRDSLSFCLVACGVRFGDCDSARAESPYISEQVAVFSGASPPPRIRVRLASLAWCVCPLFDAD